MNSEMEALPYYKTLDPVDLSTGKYVIGCRWAQSRKKIQATLLTV